MSHHAFLNARSFVSAVLIGAVSSTVTAQSTSAALTQVVNKATPTLAIASGLSLATYGQSVTLTTTLASALATNATGTVQWYDTGTALGSPTPVTSATSTLTVPLFAPGTHTITATYSGDTNFNTATSPSFTETVERATSAVTLASSLNPSVYQNSVTLTATVTPGATGTVVFMDGSTALGTVSLTGGSATYTVSTLAAATHSLTAVYSGDSNFLSATSTALSQIVTQAPTVESVYATPATGAEPGTSVTFTALVNTGMLQPTGTVTFLDGTTSLGSGTVSTVTTTNLLPFSANYAQWTPYDAGAAAPTVGSATQGPDGASASATTITLPVTTGTGVYSGLQSTATGNFAGKQMVVSFWAQSSTGIQLTANLSDGSGANTQTAPAKTTNTWQRFVLPMTMSEDAAANAILSISAVNQAGGNIALYGVQLEQAATAGPYVLTNGASAAGSGGMATFTTSNLLDGSHMINVAYSGDTNYTASTGAMAQPYMMAKGTATATVTSSSLTANYGQTVTFTANVTGTGATPTGTVTFWAGSTQIGSGTLTAGSATMSTAALTAGTHAITIQYSGDSNFNGVASNAITQTINQDTATVVVASSLNPSTFGQPVIFTVTVTGTGATPTGTVVLSDGATTIGTMTLNATGQAALTTQTLTGGTHTLTFTYSGDTNYLP